MPKIFNDNNVSFKLKQASVPEFCWHSSVNLAELVDSQQLNFNIRSLDPDRYTYPYHYHWNAEELFVILSGKALLRTPNGVEEVSEGDVIFFETGPEGAHQLYNHTQEPCKFLDICTNMGFDVCQYPDSNKLALKTGQVFQLDEEVDYFKDEDKVREKWGHIPKS